MKLVVVGAGRVGLAILQDAAPEDELVVVDNDPERARRAATRQPRAHVIEGDATEEAVLRKTGAPDVDALVSATPNDPTNLMVCTLAKRIGVKNVVTRVSGDSVVPLFAEIGVVPVQNPSHLTAEYLYHAFQVPDVRTFMPVGEDTEVVTLALGARSKLAGRAVKDARLPRDALIIAINRAGRIIVPTADLKLREGDVLTLVARTHLLDHLVGRILGKPAQRITERVRGLFRG